MALSTSDVGSQGEDKTEPRVSQLERDLAAVKTELAEMRREFKLLQGLILQRIGRSSRVNPVVATVRMSDSPALGREDAPVTIVEFSDYQCPSCKRFFETALPILKREYIDTGQVRYVFKDFPIDRLHPYAHRAAQAARCAGAQGKYWEMHDALFQNQHRLQNEAFQTHAQTLGLNVALFDDCVTANRFKEAVDRDFREGRDAGLTGTPGFIIGRVAVDGRIDGVTLSGAQPIEAFRDAIGRMLQPAQRAQ